MSFLDVVKNVFWLLLDKVLRVAVGVYVFSQMSSGLGQESFGFLNYVLSVIAILGALVSMGMQNVIVKYLVSKKSGLAGQSIVLTVIYTQALTALFIYLILFLSVFYLFNVENVYVYLLLGVLIVCRPSDVFKYWFESNLKMKSVVMVENIIFVLFSIVKILAIENGFGVTGIAFIFALEYVLSAIGLMVVYALKREDDFEVRFNRGFVLTVFRSSWPLLVSSVAWVGYIKIDQIMVGIILGDVELAYFAASSKIVESVYFIPAVIISSVYPYLFTAGTGSDVKGKSQILYSVLTWPVICIVAIISLFSDDLILLIYGGDYSSSADVLVVQMWCLMFVAFTIATGRYLVEVGQAQLIMYRHLTGLFLNILLNFIFLNAWGVIGGAIATLTSLFVASVLLDLLNKKTRFLFGQKIRSFYPLPIFQRMFSYEKKQ